ncbi:hypothetical protein H0H93_008403 [Arthromyces matolae]|nr:hypothetical protein H0H93_008403 [Arthromyces matolae]
MAFPQLPSYMNSQLQDGNGLPSASPLDSITLGQLKAMVGSVPKPKQSCFDFLYDDEDNVINEIDEFYAYVEMPQVAENVKAWEGSFPSGESLQLSPQYPYWTKAPLSQRKTHVELLLESLEHRDAEVRFTNARRLFYVLQGTFAETVSPEHQLHWIFENCKVVRSANGVSTIVEAMKIASSKHDMLCGLSDLDAAHFHISAQEKADLTDEVVTEIYIYLGMLYHLVEIFKGHDDFADELMSLDPPLPVYLFNVISGLRDKGVRTYPIKKLLLLLWKTILACCGGSRELSRVKKLSRELSGLPAASETTDIIKSSPLDMEAFRQETAVKYPTFSPPHKPILAPIPLTSELPKGSKAVNPPLLSSRLAQAYSPIPVRHHYHHEDDSNNGMLGGPPHFHSNPPPSYRPLPQPATPAPSPPPSPKPKKQQYQTDQNRPFLFPFPKGQFGKDARYVPFAINEADQLYNKHMYISLSLWQMWRTREDCITAESGLDHMPGEDEFQSSTFNANQDPEVAEPLPDLAVLDAKIEEASETLQTSQSNAEKKKARERKEDLMRLKRIEQIYSAVLPGLNGWVSVLLKLLLATVSPDRAMQAQDQPPAPPPTLDEIDVTRHREVTSKAVSAIILLILKWFKVSHVMKFHHLGQHLLDSNCLLLILKIFGLQEVATSVTSKADAPDHKNAQHARPEDNQPRPLRQTVIKTTMLPNGEKHEEEIEQLTDYSWRNFFSAINFAKIMQKLSKGRSHRIWMLVQYKSSAILKRVLKVPHPMLQLHVLKLIKSQVPFCGRKWRQSNMKVITSIYLNCRPDLRDEWLTGSEVDDASDAQAQEIALRHLVKFYNTKRYGPTAASGQHGPLHRKSGSISHHIDGLPAGPEISGLVRPLGTPNTVDSDVFPPARAHAPDPSIFLPYITEDIAFEEEYEEYLSDMGWTDPESAEGALFNGGNSAWHRLPAFASEIADNISDSESIVSIGDLGDDARLDTGRDDDRDSVDENLNNWEQHMSPKTMAALPKSPAGARRSSSGSGLRPVLPFGLDDGSAIDADDDDEIVVGPVPRDESNPFASGAGVDEVEYAYG